MNADDIFFHFAWQTGLPQHDMQSKFIMLHGFQKLKCNESMEKDHGKIKS